MKQTIRFIILFLILVIGAGNTWAADITTSDIIINVLPNNAAGTVTVTEIQNPDPATDTKVIISAVPTPSSGYTIDKNHIVAEKMVDPSASRRASGLSSPLTINKEGGNSFSFTIPAGYSGAYVTVTFYKKSEGFTSITDLSQITDPAGKYQITADINAAGNTSLEEFTGTLDGGFHKIYNLSQPLFSSTDGATICNVIFEDVSISSGDADGDAGAVTSKANGATRIYNCGVLATGSIANTDEDGYTYLTNCSSTINGSGYVGSIVGLLDGSSRVINCFSYANVSGGTVGGIVGYNKVATTATNLKTMVMNCMFYGEVSGGSIAPIYNGNIITNVGKDTGVSNFNYFRLESSYIQNNSITKVYNCALGAETRFLQRFEFYRHLLNSNRKLAAWWATGSTANKDEMAKWILLPSQIGTSTPYPVLAKSGYYPSVVNIDAENAPVYTERNKGGKMGTLPVTIQMGSGGAVFDPPTDAEIVRPSLTLKITDKDPDHFNFNYYKVQLPYYNDVGTKNYTGNRVVTGWKIVSITGGTAGSFTTGDDATTDANGKITSTPYNFADRNCTNKDLYSVSGRVFNQGAYWDVPEGVTAITIEPYWAKAAYVADANADVVYSTDMKTAYNVPTVGGGTIYTNGNSYTIAGESQKVFTTINNAVTNANGLNKPTSNSVNDYAVVLVGNVHQYTADKAAIGGSYKYTVTSIDLDGDNEPDYSLMLRDDNRNNLHPVKWDFLNLVGLGMAQKSTGGTGSYNLGILCPQGWFETTNTALFRVTQMEYEFSNKVDPLIVQGGVMEQWVSTNQKGTSNGIPYYHVGGNVWFKEFHLGCHQDKSIKTKHSPVSVTGGDYDEFYLTGLYRGDVTNYEDNAECYINGGRFGIVAGAAMEGIGKANGANDTGNITWQIQNADIKEFYAGGINAASGHTVTGNLSTTITGGKIDLFCGGPKFGDMSTNKIVVTNATGCEFGTFFGAGYGGNSYSREAPRNHNNIVNFPHNDAEGAGNHASWNAWVADKYTQSYSTTYGGVSTQFNYQFLPMSNNTNNVARLFVEYVKFSLATTRNVTSTLTNCTITGNFYGGGSLGMVDGPVTSTLNNCNVIGNVFGAGYSASLPTVEVDAIGFETEPYYYTDLGTYRKGVKGATTTYTWEQGTAISVDNTNHILYTTENLNDLGTVSGNVTVNILGDNTLIQGDVYGGGAEAKSNTDYYKDSNPVTTTKTTVNVLGGTIRGDVYGSGLGRLAKDAVGTPGSEGYTPAVTAVAADAGNVKVNLNGMDAAYYKADYTTLERNGEGDDAPYVVKDSEKGCIVKGRIFGCNNLNGTPKGQVTVHIFKTQRNGATRITNTEQYTEAKVFGEKYTEGKNKGNYNLSTFDVQAVYGGGNLAAYVPNPTTANDEKTRPAATVIIDGCGSTSIGQVYGGGNAASTPATSVTVNGTFEIGEVFGGGNGKDDITINGVTTTNPGANVGFHAYEDNVEGKTDTPTNRATYYGYGSGAASVNIFGGKIHSVFGGSNTKGNVRITAVTLLEEKSDAEGAACCEFDVDEAYGGGKSAPMDAEAKLLMQCIPGLKEAYGGAEAADIQGNVVLTITNGTFNRVFGGNNLSGTIRGSINVNIEETGCKPIIIGELYGGGNEAGYSVRGYKQVTEGEGANAVTKWVPRTPEDALEPGMTAAFADPQVNVKSFTSIGEVFGGGYGVNAVMVGNPTVNINEVVGEQANTAAAEIADGEKVRDEYPVPSHAKGKIGAVNNVFGGGNAAQVIGNTTVNVGTLEKITYVSAEDDPDTTDVDESMTEHTVIGADIRGNVYGGGNAAEVTGNTNVTIGKEK